jgi:peptidase M50B-like protein
MGPTQVPLSGTEATVIGVGALIAVTLDLTWALAVYGQLMAHEGAHGVIGSVFFLRVTGITLKEDENGPSGLTGVTTAPGLRGCLFYFIGYLGSSMFGLGAAKLIQAGYIVAVVWVTLFLLGVLLLWVINLWGRFTVLLIGGLVFAVGHYTPMSDQVIAAYAIAWLLLLSGVRLAFEHGAGAKDAMILRDRTAIPRAIWALVWITGTLGAVVIGGRMLVMHHLRRVGAADTAGSGRMPQGPSMYEMEGPCFGFATPVWLVARPSSWCAPTAGARNPLEAPASRSSARPRVSPGGPVSNGKAIVTASLEVAQESATVHF